MIWLCSGQRNKRASDVCRFQTWSVKHPVKSSALSFPICQLNGEDFKNLEESRRILEPWLTLKRAKQEHPCWSVARMKNRASLVAQWLRIRLPTQGTRVRALVREDPTCCGATKPMCHNYWACTLEPASHNYWARVPQLLKSVHLEPVLCNKRSHRNEKHMHCNEA